MKKNACWTALALLLLATTACGTLFNSGTRQVALSSTPSAAEVWINGERQGTTPLTLDLDNHNGHMVTFRMAGHDDVVCQLNASIEVKWLVLDILGGPIPIIVDASTGKWKSLESDNCNVTLPARQGTLSEEQMKRLPAIPQSP